MGEGDIRLVRAHLRSLLAGNLAEQTIYQRRRALVRLVVHAQRPLLEMTPDHIEEFLTRGTVGPDARAVETSHVKGFYRWAVRNGHLAHDPTEWLRRPRLHPHLPRPIADEDLVLALKAPPERVAPWLHLAAYAGLRACEVARTRGENVERSGLVVHGKGGKVRYVPIGAALEPIVETMPRKGYWFTRHDDRPGPVPAHLVSHLSNRHLHGIGVASTFHSLRHWFGTHLYRLTRDLAYVQEIMGHASPVTTRGYTWIDLDEHRHAFDAFPPPG